MKRSFSGMTAQQAPSPRTARQAALLLPSGTLQTALSQPHCTRLTSPLPSTRMSSSEMMVEGMVANRLARSHAMILPANERWMRGRADGSGLSGMSEIAVMPLALHQCDARVVPVHQETDGQADGEEHHHDQRDRLDR